MSEDQAPYHNFAEAQEKRQTAMKWWHKLLPGDRSGFARQYFDMIPDFLTGRQIENIYNKQHEA